MSANKIIDELGGTVEAARFFEVTTGAVSQWRKAGIPRARMMYVRAMRPDIIDLSDTKVGAGETAQQPMKEAA